MSYASAKGRTPRQIAPIKSTPPADLSDEEKAVIADRVRQVKAHIPEAWDFMKDLHEAGLVDGMRCILSVTVFEGDEHGFE